MKNNLLIIRSVIVLIAVIILTIPIVNAANESNNLQGSISQSLGVQSLQNASENGNGTIHITDSRINPVVVAVNEANTLQGSMSQSLRVLSLKNTAKNGNGTILVTNYSGGCSWEIVFRKFVIVCIGIKWGKNCFFIQPHWQSKYICHESRRNRADPYHF